MSRHIGKPAICICENKDADQLRSNCKADQLLCFHYIYGTIPLLLKSKIKNLARFCDCTGWFVLDLVRTPNCWFSHAKVQMVSTLLYFSKMEDCTFFLSLRMGKPTIWFVTRSDTNQPVQLQKMARSLKFCIYKVDELYYPCSKNLKALISLADLWLCFSIFRLLVFLCSGSIFFFLFSLKRSKKVQLPTCTIFDIWKILTGVETVNIPYLF